MSSQLFTPSSPKNPEINRLRRRTHNFLDGLDGVLREIDHYFGSILEQNAFPSEIFSYLPQADIQESDKELTISVELPGVDAKDVEISLSGNVLTVRGEKKLEHEEKKENYFLIEREYGKFLRTFKLPYETNPENIKAEFSKGILNLRFPKPKDIQEKTKKIEVKMKD